MAATARHFDQSRSVISNQARRHALTDTGSQQARKVGEK